MTAKQLAYHVYQLAYVLTRAAETGTIDAKTLDEIPFDAEGVRDARQIVAYGARVKSYMRTALDGLTDDMLAPPTTNGRGSNATAASCLLLIVEEAIHHRGQLVTYLRMMGVQPPYLYQYDGEK